MSVVSPFADNAAEEVMELRLVEMKASEFRA